jgi:mono/diheme cytochrome c family protein
MIFFKSKTSLLFIVNMVVLLLIIQSTSCTHKVEDQYNVPVTKDTACDPNLVYFVNDIQPILNSNCAYSGCHDVVTHKDGVDLSSYDKVMSTGGVVAGNPSGSELYKKIQEGKMPPSGILDASMQQMIYDWISQGALNNECVEGCDSINVTYSLTIKPIMDSYCKGCHSGGSPSGGISITDYNQTKALASNGKLMGTIEHQAGYSPMPKNSAKLSDCNIKQLNKWINDGMQNN